MAEFISYWVICFFCLLLVLAVATRRKRDDVNQRQKFLVSAGGIVVGLFLSPYLVVAFLTALPNGDDRRAMTVYAHQRGGKVTFKRMWCLSRSSHSRTYYVIIETPEYESGEVLFVMEGGVAATDILWESGDSNQTGNIFPPDFLADDS